MLAKEINLNKKFILIFVLINIIALGLYYSYALFQVNVIKDNVIVIHTGTINLTVSATGTGVSNNSFTLNSGETKEITINLSTTKTGEIGYKLYYTRVGTTTLEITPSRGFGSNVVAGTMTTSDSFTLTFKNTGNKNITITIGGIGGIAGYPIPLADGQNEIRTVAVTAANVSYTAPEGVTCDDGDGHCTFQVMIDQMASMLD